MTTADWTTSQEGARIDAQTDSRVILLPIVGHHAYAVDIHFMYPNFCRPHMTRTKNHPHHYPTTPAMAAGIAGHVWSLEGVHGLLDPARLLGVA